MDMQDLPLGKISQGDIETVTGILVDEADDHVDLAAGFEQVVKDRIVRLRTAGDSRHEVLQDVSGQGQLWKNNQIGTLLPGLLDQVQVFRQVRLDISKRGVDLGKGQVDFHVLFLSILPQGAMKKNHCRNTAEGPW